MTLAIQPGLLRGEVTVPPSKSLSHRALIASFLSNGGVVENLAENDDIAATRDCLDGIKTGGVLNCRESGSTMRFLIPLALVFREEAFFIGSGRLLERPMEPYARFFDMRRSEDGFAVRGKLKPGRFPLPGNVSSQFVTGLLFALPLLDGESEITLTSPLESKPYVDLTLQALTAFGVRIDAAPDGWAVPGRQAYRPCRYTVEGDESAAAFWRVANALGSEVTCAGLNPNSIQGDRVMTDIIRDGVRVIDVRECPDLVPALAVLCCFRDGESRIVNAGRLRIKESDRLSAVTLELNRLGARIAELPDGLVIQGVQTLNGGSISSHNDHRIAMALAIAATRCGGAVTIRGAECAGKSYPGFFEDFRALGGLYEYIR
ncbi:MAG: 3-phosphoshikimate 1-carboxyvinyltransferase [Oscillospiraceae bacterium]|nr:3-phosphoshikimate 1-carboxyvinyltransferase [Oscillospiraceae bacterium]